LVSSFYEKKDTGLSLKIKEARRLFNSLMSGEEYWKRYGKYSLYFGFANDKIVVGHYCEYGRCYVNKVSFSKLYRVLRDFLMAEVI